MDTKHFIYSKTLWLAVLVGLIGVIQAIPAEALSPQASAVAHVVLMVLIAINRFIGTTTALTTAKEAPTTEQFNG